MRRQPLSMDARRLMIFATTVCRVLPFIIFAWLWRFTLESLASHSLLVLPLAGSNGIVGFVNSVGAGGVTIVVVHVVVVVALVVDLGLGGVSVSIAAVVVVQAGPASAYSLAVCDSEG